MKKLFLLMLLLWGTGLPAEAQYIFPLTDTTVYDPPPTAYPAYERYQDMPLSRMTNYLGRRMVRKSGSNRYVLFSTYNGYAEHAIGTSLFFFSLAANTGIGRYTAFPYSFEDSRYWGMGPKPWMHWWAYTNSVAHSTNGSVQWLSLQGVRSYLSPEPSDHEVLAADNLLWSMTDPRLYCTFTVDDTTGYRYDSVYYSYPASTLDNEGNLYVLRVGVHNELSRSLIGACLGYPYPSCNPPADTPVYYTIPYTCTQVYKILKEDLARAFEDSRHVNKRLPATLIAGKAPAACDFKSLGVVSPDGTPASDMVLGIPTDIAFSPDGQTLYICDYGHKAIRKISNGVLGTVAGAGNGSHTSWGGPVDYYPNPLEKRGEYSGDDGPAAAADFSGPVSISVEPRTGNIFVSDIRDTRLRKIDVSTGIISKYVGKEYCKYEGDFVDKEAAYLYMPGRIDFDSIGNMYFSDIKGPAPLRGYSRLGYGLPGGAFDVTVIRKICLYPTRVTIAAAGGPACTTGVTVTLQASSVNAVEPLPYVWVRNGVPTGDTGRSYTFTPQYGDEVYCYVLSGLHACADSTHVVSNVMSYVRPAYSITASDNGTVTEGSAVTLTATSSVGGGLHRWFVNQVEIAGVNTATYSYIPQNGDVVYAVWQRSVGCPGDTVHSNRLTLQTVPVGIGDPALETVTLHPNPARTHLYLNNSGTLQAVISSMDGKVHWEGSVGAHGAIEVKDWARGMYLLSLYFKDGSRKVLKWVKE